MMRAIYFITLLSLVTISSTYCQTTVSLHVGDPAPIFIPYKWIKGEPVTQFKKGHVYVIEFGATWCKPCIIMIPHLSELSRKYKGNVTVVSAFVMESNDEPLQVKDPKYVSRVESFVSKRQDAIIYSVAVDDPAKTVERNWLRAAGKIGIPFTFIIDKHGMVSAITSGIDNIQKAIETALSEKYNIIEQIESGKKAEVAKVRWDYTKLMLIDGNGGASDDFMFRSLISKYKGDIPKQVLWYVASQNDAKPGSDRALIKGMFQSTGMTLSDLYRLAYSDTLTPYPTTRLSNGKWPDTTANPYAKSAYGKFWYDPILEMQDKTPFTSPSKSPDNKFNYSIKVPLEKSSARFLQQVMRSDLKNYFGYDVVVEERMMPYWRIVLLPGEGNKLRTATPGRTYSWVWNDEITNYTRDFTTNATMRDVIVALNNLFGFGAHNMGNMPEKDIAAFVDETNFKGEFDMILEPPFYDSFINFRKYLNSLGIDIVKGEKNTRVIVIHDPH